MRERVREKGDEKDTPASSTEMSSGRMCVCATRKSPEEDDRRGEIAGGVGVCEARLSASARLLVTPGYDETPR